VVSGILQISSSGQYPYQNGWFNSYLEISNIHSYQLLPFGGAA